MNDTINKKIRYGLQGKANGDRHRGSSMSESSIDVDCLVDNTFPFWPAGLMLNTPTDANSIPVPVLVEDAAASYRLAPKRTCIHISVGTKATTGTCEDSDTLFMD